ncbi:MAG TPA: AAA family ATPase [Phycisphaerae bacterium]|nr:AAA family ATPase [Phycisphaerae bacterium]
MTAMLTSPAPMTASHPGTPPEPEGGFFPKPPASFKRAGLDPATVESLILKYLFGVGSAMGAKIAEELCLPARPVVDYLAGLKQQQIVVYVGASEMDDFRYTLTDSGRDRARRFMVESMYVGAAPVPIDAYISSIQAQTITALSPQADDLQRAFSDLLITQEMFDVLGPAINSGRGMFLYGPPGNGKTAIAERITRCFGDEIYIPRCLIVDGLIIKLFDPAVHEEIPVARDSIFKKDQIDTRWVKVRRPTIVVGGELTMEALDVQYNAASRTCEASTQLKSNCGTLVIDDFGRQRMKPIELLNRWIVPLEKRFDYLALPNGKKVRVPFDQLIIFSTNLEPKDLCDDAFLRRIPYKINVPDAEETAFRKLFEFVSPGLGFTFDDQARAAVDHLIEKHYRPTGRPFRFCQPRDLLLQAKNRCLYLGRPPAITAELFDYAVSVYFTIM